MREKEIEFKVITPVFSYGADKKTPEIRMASLKGVMRYTYRITQQEVKREHLDQNEETEKLKTEPERLLFLENQFLGDADKNISPVRLVLTNSLGISPSIGKPFLLHNKKRNERWNKVNCIEPEKNIQIRLSLRKNATENLERYQALIELSLIIGGLGQRSRRGRGRIQNMFHHFKTREDAMKYITTQLNKISETGNYDIAGNEIKPEKPAGNNVKRPVIQKIIFGNIVKKQNGKPAWDALLTKLDKASSATKYEHDKNSNNNVRALGQISGIRFSSSLIVGAVEIEEGLIPIYTQVRAVVKGRILDAENEWKSFIEEVEGKGGANS